LQLVSELLQLGLEMLRPPPLQPPLEVPQRERELLQLVRLRCLPLEHVLPLLALFL
jgi:hypothetical protein